MHSSIHGMNSSMHGMHSSIRPLTINCELFLQFANFHD
jgi:hypothetical protein